MPQPEHEVEATKKPKMLTALICDRLLIERDDSVSAIRLIDQYTVALAGDDAPESMPMAPLRFSALAVFRSEGAKGMFNVSMTHVSPSGVRADPMSVEMTLESDAPQSGVNNIFDVQLVTDEPGVHWLVVELDGIAQGRIPLSVVYRRTAGTGLSGLTSGQQEGSEIESQSSPKPAT